MYNAITDMVDIIRNNSSIDLQWLKHYSEETIDKMINFEVKDESMYETLYKYASKHLEDVAFEYLGVKCTYKQLLYNIDRTVRR